jgi:hypothetical protein
MGLESVNELVEELSTYDFLAQKRVPRPSFAVLAKEGGDFNVRKSRKAPPSPRAALDSL